MKTPDIAAAVDKLIPGADFRRADTYPDLVRTWKDARKIPSEDEVIAAALAVEKEQASSELRTRAKREAADIFSSLSLDVRVAFGEASATVQHFLDKGQWDAAVATVEAVKVPAELQSMKDQIVAKLKEGITK